MIDEKNSTKFVVLRSRYNLTTIKYCLLNQNNEIETTGGSKNLNLECKKLVNSDIYGIRQNMNRISFMKVPYKTAAFDDARIKEVFKIKVNDKEKKFVSFIWFFGKENVWEIRNEKY